MTKEPKTEEEILQIKLTKLEEECGASYTQLQQETGQSMEVGDLRLNLFIEFLRDEGIMTKAQYLRLEIQFHEKVKGFLDDFWEKYREAQKHVAKLPGHEDKKKKLMVPKPASIDDLVLPPSARKK